MNNTMSISDVRANFPDLVSKVNSTLGRITITVNGKPKAILLSSDELESLEETSEVLAIPGAEVSIKKGLAEAKKRKGTSILDL